MPQVGFFSDAACLGGEVSGVYADDK